MEAGVPVPIPADLVMLAVGARVGAGNIPLAVAVVAFEAVAIVGTTALFLAARGPGHAPDAPFGEAETSSATQPAISVHAAATDQERRHS